jgi:outer membrane protein OmpA-like peptidoglycan-associated protein
MRIVKFTAGIAALAISFLLTASVRTPAQTITSIDQVPTNVKSVTEGQKMKIKGYVLKRGADTFIMRDSNGTDTEVLLGTSTSVKTFRRDVFHGNMTYPVTYLTRGLRLQVEGRGNAAGQLMAQDIRFDERDVRVAQSLETRVKPVEALAAANEQRIGVTEESDRKLAGQIDEVQASLVAMRTDTAKAQATADDAVKAAALANNRLNGLDEYELVKSVTVHFNTRSSVLTPAAKEEIDQAAAWTTNATTKGWIVEVIGFADSRGTDQYNLNLSTRRANAVIGYLVTQQNIPPHRLVQPFGFGEAQPVADNATTDGRTLNRRVEIRVLVNKGIANTIN